MNTFILGYLIYIGTHFIRELFFRKGKEAKKIRLGVYGKYSSVFNGIYIIVLCLLPLILQYYNFGFVQINNFVGIFGIITMFFGILIHFVAIKTMGEFFTRTLMITKNHSIIKTGIYEKIRHPGYLGTILIGIGFGLSSNNWILMFVILILLFFVYFYRIISEEKMLIKQFGKKYIDYQKNTWIIIPYIL